MQIRCISRPIPHPSGGALRIVTDVGWGMRWTRAAPKTTALAARTAKSCGPDAPTLASSLGGVTPHGGDGGKKARSPGRARYKPLKPLRREGRTDPVNLWRLRSCALFYFAHEASGALATRLSLRPLSSRVNGSCTPWAHSRCGNAESWLFDN